MSLVKEIVEELNSMDVIIQPSHVGIIKQSCPRCSGSLWGFCLALLLFLSLCFGFAQNANAQDANSNKPTQTRLEAGLNSDIVHQAFVESANNEEIIQLGSDSKQFLARFRQPPQAYTLAILALVSKDADLMTENLATAFLEELATIGWPVMLVSLGDLQRSEAEDKSMRQELNLNKILESIQFLREKAVSSIMILADEKTTEAAISGAIRFADDISILAFNDVLLSEMPDGKTMSALLESRVSILDVVNNEFDKSVLRARRQWYEKQGFGSVYRLMTSPDAIAGDRYVAKRARAWLDRNFSK